MTRRVTDRQKHFRDGYQLSLQESKGSMDGAVRLHKARAFLGLS